ncbi:hypothetical protein MNBD_NITROSPINAE03-951 [hydrothermal vent metagenome]|uniref:HAMP domain-containing protein n=1 Tax=hydrothermal vent metagenome TaxID=652676 RepID=A0A3B1BYP3_9ZZZZ
MKKTGIFRDELPGEKKSIVNLLMTGYIVVISCLGYTAFYIFIQMVQLERIVATINVQTQTPEQVQLLRDRMTRTTGQLRNEIVGLAIFGTVICLIGGGYTINMVIRPLRRLVEFAESNGATILPEFKSNTELKQLATALGEKFGSDASRINTETQENPAQKNKT